MPVVATRERPIIFTGESVRAILAGEKTQSRRVIKPQPPEGQWVDRCHYGKTGWALWGPPDEHGLSGCNCYREVRCPYGQPGDRLYVKEAWWSAEDIALADANLIVYRADWDEAEFGAPWHYDYPTKDWEFEAPTRWRSPIYMPRWASRLTLELTEVRVERLQDITEEDARAEGLVPLDGGPEDEDDRDWSICSRCGGLRVHNALGADYGVIFDVDCTDCDTYVKRFRHRWDSINGKKPGCAWEDSPYVWCLSFRRMEEQI